MARVYNHEVGRGAREELEGGRLRAWRTSGSFAHCYAMLDDVEILVDAQDKRLRCEIQSGDPRRACADPLLLLPPFHIPHDDVSIPSSARHDIPPARAEAQAAHSSLVLSHKDLPRQPLPIEAPEEEAAAEGGSNELVAVRGPGHIQQDRAQRF
eukprot:767238-Hanusia_phi.AAC.3